MGLRAGESVCACVHPRAGVYVHACVHAHTYVRETLMVFHVVGKKKKRHINQNSQRERWGEREALMSRWRRISVFHVERFEGRGNVTANKINVQHKQARGDEL